MKENLTCACRQEIDRLLERIKVLEEQKEIEKFGFKGLCFQNLGTDNIFVFYLNRNAVKTTWNVRQINRRHSITVQ